MIFKVISFVIDLLHLPTLFYLVAISSIDVGNHDTNDTVFCQESIAIANCALGVSLYLWVFLSLGLYTLTHDIKKQGRVRILWVLISLALEALIGVFLFIYAIRYLAVVSYNPERVDNACYIFQPGVLVLSLLIIIEIMYRMIAYYNRREFWQNTTDVDDAKVDANPA